MKRRPLVLGLLAAAAGAWALLALASDPDERIGSLEWTEQTGGALSAAQKTLYVMRAVPGLGLAALRRLAPAAAPRVAAASFTPPDTPIVGAALKELRETLDPAFVNHSIRTACWTVVVMQREQGPLSPRQLEEAWMAGLLHDVGLAHPPPRGEFTLGGVAAVNRLAAQFGWSAESAQRAGEAITLNPNSRVDRARYGLLAWAMNIGGFGETFYGPYRVLMDPEDIRVLEARYPREHLDLRAAEAIARETRRYPDQRFEVLHDIGFLLLTRRG